MTTLDHCTETTRSAARPVNAMRIVNYTTDLFRAWKNRRAFYRLGEMTDTELADVGLTRGDLHVAVDLPFASDPTARLRSIRQSRSDNIEVLARRVA
ncbi:DUF1127 domain-containing protein [Aminobacter anthyllidis]|uniref:DUF1127 domain-containing protein n=1 Tax=Aminobacter anthyllidis TaxID=1035067 RepID=A0A9X1A9B7_9HYPH|nr:DUF1127 domain-containing protein [Aminobacter anthyllidis]MBT1155624.1 DUF1127 domain-containing protein [Aminobacter anthyllidis]MDH4986046.1 DUF1127 domain-containing protein [Aminobacter anthyllidis]